MVTSCDWMPTYIKVLFMLSMGPCAFAQGEYALHMITPLFEKLQDFTATVYIFFQAKKAYKRLQIRLIFSQNHVENFQKLL